MAKPIWKQHAKEATKEKCFPGKIRILIHCISWLSDPKFRKEIANDLALILLDKRITEVSQVVAGRSFDGIRCIGSANKKEILERWNRP